MLYHHPIGFELIQFYSYFSFLKKIYNIIFPVKKTKPITLKPRDDINPEEFYQKLEPFMGYLMILILFFHLKTYTH